MSSFSFDPIILIGLISLIVVIAAVVIIVVIVSKNKSKKNDKGHDYYSQSRTVNESLGAKIRKVFAGRQIDEDAIEELEEILLKADIGPRITFELIEKLRSKPPKNTEEAISMLKEEIGGLLIDDIFKLEKGDLNIVLVLGVNGVGKTTSIAKLANYYLKKDFKVLLAAGDTFRAAATEQLSMWASRLDIPVIKQGQNADPSSVVFDAVDSARAKNVDLLLVDTAGRLHNKKNLIEELKKIERVIQKKGEAVKKNMLVVDATTGQNAFAQADSFNAAVGLDGIIITKYDSQAKGGMVINIQKTLGIPFYFVGTGEKLEDINEFNKHEFIENIFS